MIKSKEYFYLASKNIRRRKLRSWLTMIGIIISIATIFLLVSISLGLNFSVEEQFRQLGTDKFFIMPSGQLAGPATSSAAQLTPDDLVVIKKVSGVRDYSYISAGSVEVKFSDQIRYVNAIGIPLDKISVFKESGFMTTTQGKYLSSGDSKKVVVGSQFGESLFKDPVKVGNTIKINNQNFRVKGILKTQGNPTDDKSLHMSLDDLEFLFPDKKDKYSEIIVQINPGHNVKDIAKKVEKQLFLSRGVTDKTKDFTILTPEQLLATFGVILNVLTGFLLGVAGISLIVGGIGITNTMYTAVIERTKEIGVMKAIGARNSDIIYLFTIESGLLGLVGGIGGVILGYVVGKFIEFLVVNVFSVTMFKVLSPWYVVVGCLAFSFFIGAVSGIIPAYKASRIKTIEALRYE